MEGHIDIEVWGLVPSPRAEKSYSFVTGPYAAPSLDEYPDNLRQLGDVVLEAIRSVCPSPEGVWERPKHIRITAELVDGLDIAPLVEMQQNPQTRQHLQVVAQQALEDYRDGKLSHRRLQQVLQVAENQRMADLLTVARNQVQMIHLRWMGRWTSYYIDKYEVLRLLDQLIEDAARGHQNIQRALREELHRSETGWTQTSADAPPHRRHTGTPDPRLGADLPGLRGFEGDPGDR